MYKAQQTASTVEERQQIITQMQQILYKDIPEIVLWYDNELQAYNSTNWTGLEDNISSPRALSGRSTRHIQH